MKVTESNKKNKSNTKIYLVFAVIIVASLVGGFFAGKLVGASKSSLNEIDWNNIWAFTADTFPIVYGVLVLAVFVAIFVMYGIFILIAVFLI